MHREQRQRTRELLKKQGIERALFAHPESVTWLTGFAPVSELQSPFQAGPHLVWYDGGSFTLITQDFQAPYAGDYAHEPDGGLILYEGYAVEHPIRSTADMAGQLAGLMRGSRGSGAVGVEIDSVSTRQFHALNLGLNMPEIKAIDHWLKPLRMIKTGEEIAKLRRAFELTDIAFDAARGMVKPGITEIEVWSAAHSAIQNTDGLRSPLGNDCVVSYREFNVGGLPAKNVLHEGDSIIIDLSARHQGYWSDGCRVFYANEPTSEQKERHHFVENALDYAISLIKPGAKAKDVDAAVRAFVERGGYPVYPHHTGHSLGTGMHEEPRIVPYNDMTIEAGMVILLEPATYVFGESACRIEDGLIVQADGVEILSYFPRRSF
ncbi:MAG: aminopeptidase P family protein [Anaerolineae bacterium]|nr:aminopeptidase P family protein [Anaerolineae bacterium]